MLRRWRFSAGIGLWVLSACGGQNAQVANDVVPPEIVCSAEIVHTSSSPADGGESSHARALAGFLSDSFPELDLGAFSLTRESKDHARYELRQDSAVKAYVALVRYEQLSGWTEAGAAVCSELLGSPEPVEESSNPPRDLYGDEY